MSEAETEEALRPVDATVLRVRPFESGWTILSVDRAGMSETWVGMMPEVKEGMPVRATGKWETHAKHGRQFKVATLIVKMPDAADPHSLATFLSKLVTGVGIRTTNRIVAALGADTIPALENDPDRIAKVKGMTAEKAKALCEEWRKHSVEGQLIVSLGRFGIKGAVAKKVVKRYGGRAIDMVEKHPFRLAMEVDGIGFKTADLIAKTVGIPHDSTERMEAGLLYTIEEKVSGRGHCYTHREYLFDEAAKLLDVGDGPLSEGLIAAEQDGLVVIEHADSDDPRIYLTKIHEAEVRVVGRVHRILRAPALLRKVEENPVPDGWDDFENIDRLESEGELPRTFMMAPPLVQRVPAPPLSALVEHGEKAIVDFERATGMALADKQKEAVRSVMRHKVFVLTGGPGTGKSASLKAILFALDAAGFDVAQCAPTGRAAKRMREATGKSASTIHRLLEYHPEHGFQRDSGNPLSATAIVLDESSMADVQLAAHLLDAVDDGARLIIVGDVDQLPSVGPGAVLKDIIDSGVVPVVRLTEIFRQAAGSRIITNAHRVNHGEMPEKPQGDSDFFWVERNDAEKAAATAIQIITDKLAGRGIQTKDAIVISPQRNGVAGVKALNERLQHVLNPDGSAVTVGKSPHQTVYRVGDPVMQTKNDYERGVFNGEIGWVVDVDAINIAMKVTIPGEPERDVIYERKHFDNVMLAYASTCHRMQGSQAKAVIVLMLKEHFMLLSRPLLYTAITRAEKLCVLVADTAAVRIALSETKRERRNTGLRERLQRTLQTDQNERTLPCPS